ncbi:major facilitator transporter [Carbonactinospora thermoautotrophica]|uniref:Drug resistance transporter n=1 Tax=Carbonactinospora thermoautotrophica TaxID=1469144 RepID=A0A132NC63_9ACTN|nr:DHA2 family efflux MFS transporter permease subunit [Carbonactinospora thermoautotrophica]KWX01199.1 Drug resistance transporter [Carbonactinospora thermoautotrophica]KWX05547.1 major facilitator transporter [Carbonactinospora thermoautotrophica]KWX07749.1 major facilitator transporter [Carbonactinospora thermoautotrophica]
MTEATAAPRYASSAGRWVIAATVLGSGMAALDATVVGIALPTLGRDFHAGFEALQWVVTGYALTLAALLLLGGALGDRYGRRRVFIVGTLWFAAASLLCGVAPNVAVLIAARALQGVGGALLTPGSLAILQASFQPADRPKAIGAWSGLGGVATAVGPFLGGYLIAAASWRLIFLINLPVAALVVAVAVRHVPETRDATAPSRLDVPGAALAVIGLGGLTYGLIEGPVRGWASPSTLAALALGVTGLVAFVVVEARSPAPMLPLGIFRSGQFSAANIVTFAVYSALGGALFLLPIQLQQVAHYTPLAAGAALLPVTAIMLLLSSRSGALAVRIGPRLQMSLGPVISAIGLALLARVDADSGYVTEVLPAMTVFGFGLATTVAPLTWTVLESAPAEHAGVASGINNAVARAAGLIAVAVLPAAAGITREDYLDPAAFTTGFRVAVLIAAATCALGGLLAAVTIRRPLEGVPPPRRPWLETHCALDAPPLRGHHVLTRKEAP